MVEVFTVPIYARVLWTENTLYLMASRIFWLECVGGFCADVEADRGGGRVRNPVDMCTSSKPHEHPPASCSSFSSGPLRTLALPYL